MAEYANPPLLSAAPADGQIFKYNAATDRLDPVSAASVGVLVVPQAHETAVSAGAAQTGAAVATANAATQTGSYVQADVQTIATLANALKTDYNKTIADVAALITEHNALVTAHNTLVAALQTAGILST